ncbi:MAG: hypothetical protein DBX97_05255 [Collinsella tanakaei]|nr:MAG: hypothetical protein DBX97_05255 [Collinsella tanakaei]
MPRPKRSSHPSTAPPNSRSLATPPPGWMLRPGSSSRRRQMTAWRTARCASTPTPPRPCLDPAATKTPNRSTSRYTAIPTTSPCTSPPWILRSTLNCRSKTSIPWGPSCSKSPRIRRAPSNSAPHQLKPAERTPRKARPAFSSTTRVVAFERMQATQAIADQTGFAPGDELFAIERVRTIDGEALILDRNFFLASAAEGLTPQIAEASIYNYLENTLGITIAMSKREITGERATERDRELLDLDDVDYLAVVKSQTFDAQGTMIECTQSRHRLDHFCFRSTAVRQNV